MLSHYDWTPPFASQGRRQQAIQTWVTTYTRSKISLASAQMRFLDLIGERPRLGTAVRGGVAERHLEKSLNADADLDDVELGTTDGPPDFIVSHKAHSDVSIECKNASPVKYQDGTPKVEVQKTRASKGDPKSRLYDDSQFDVIAACMYGPSGHWEFRYKRSTQLDRDRNFPDRIAPMQRIDTSWSTTLSQAMDR